MHAYGLHECANSLASQLPNVSPSYSIKNLLREPPTASKSVVCNMAAPDSCAEYSIMMRTPTCQGSCAKMLHTNNPLMPPVMNSKNFISISP